MDASPPRDLEGVCDGFWRYYKAASAGARCLPTDYNNALHGAQDAIFHVGTAEKRVALTSNPDKFVGVLLALYKKMPLVTAYGEDFHRDHNKGHATIIVYRQDGPLRRRWDDHCALVVEYVPEKDDRVIGRYIEVRRKDGEGSSGSGSHRVVVHGEREIINALVWPTKRYNTRSDDIPDGTPRNAVQYFPYKTFTVPRASLLSALGEATADASRDVVPYGIRKQNCCSYVARLLRGMGVSLADMGIWDSPRRLEQVADASQTEGRTFPKPLQHKENPLYVYVNPLIAENLVLYLCLSSF